MQPKKYRNELKFLCTQNQLIELEEKIRPICTLDKHVGESGKYLISSLYLDTLNHQFYYESEDGVDVREKYRIRIYDKKMEYIVLECKQKLYNKNHKIQCQLTKQQYQDILRGYINYSDFSNDALLRKFFIEYQTNMLRPSVIVEYERTPYTYFEGNIRITFDRDIASSSDLHRMDERNLDKRLIMPIDTHIFEVKYDEYLPDFLLQIVDGINAVKTPFSKYYYCRTYAKGKQL